MRQMIQNKGLSFPLLRKAKIIKAVNPYKDVVIRLLLFNEKYYWVAMMDYEHDHDMYYVGKDLSEAIMMWEGEIEAWGEKDGGWWVRRG